MDPMEVHEEHVSAGGVATRAPATGSVMPTGTGLVESRVEMYPAGYRAMQAVWLVIGIINTVLILDFVFRAFHANDVGFADFIYQVGYVLAAPFDGIFGSSLDHGTLVVRWADLLAIVVYTLVGWALAKAIRISATPRTTA